MIDAHQHFWQLERGDYGWLTPEVGSLYRDFLPEHLESLIVDAGVTGTILVQAAPTLAETHYLLSLAESVDWVKGVIGWADMGSPDFSRQLQQIKSPWLKGIRPMIQDVADPCWIIKPDLDNAFHRLVAEELIFDALVKPPQWSALLQRLVKHPELQVVVDHGAKPAMADNQLQPWRDYIRLLARETSCYCKLSGFWSEAGQPLDLAAMHPWLDILFSEFGAGRIIWGSDWPVLTTVGDYQSWLQLCRSYSQSCCQNLSSEDRHNIFAGNACRVYGINPQA